MTMTRLKYFQTADEHRYARRLFLRKAAFVILGTLFAWLVAMQIASAHTRHYHHIARSVPAGEIRCDRFGCRADHIRVRMTITLRHHARHETRARIDANGNAASGVIRSSKTGATAHVASRYQFQFQALLDDFEARGATVYYMGGIRKGRCSLGSQHPCGWAVDFCQDYRGHVSGLRDCHLPGPAEFHAIVREHGLYDGSVWCNGDYGHVQVKDSGGCNVAAHGRWGHGHRRTYAQR